MRKLLYCLISILALTLVVRAQQPTPAMTQVRDVLYRADGSPATGSLVITWPAFVTADKMSVAAGTLTLPIGSDGAVALELAPNFGATPAGSHYKVVLRLDDGTSSTEYWTVSATSPTTIGALRSVLLPSEMAMQVVSKSYLDTHVAGLANDASVVHNSGNEYISGVKTFSGDIVVGATVLDASGGVVAPENSNFVWEGDSITAGLGLAAGQDWASRAMLGKWFSGRGTKTNLAASGSMTQDVLNRYAAVHALSPAVTTNPGYFFVLIGINDLVHTADSSMVIFGRLQSIWSEAQADGYKVVAATMMGMQGLTPDRELQRQALNLSIRTSSNWDYLLDFDAVLQDPSDLSLFQDGLHPTAPGAVLLGRTAANLMPSSMASSENLAPAYDQTIAGWSSVGRWLTVGMTGATDTLRVLPQTAGQGVQVVATDVGSTNYRPLTMVGSSVQYSQNGGSGDLLTLYPGGPGIGSTLASTTSNQGQYTPLTENASEFRFGKGMDTLHFYPGVTGTGTNISSARADLSAYSPLPIKASNWSVDASGNFAAASVQSSASTCASGTPFMKYDGTCAEGGSSAFSALSGGTNTSAAMVVGSGSSLSATGTGTIVATTATHASNLPADLATQSAAAPNAATFTAVNAEIYLSGYGGSPANTGAQNDTAFASAIAALPAGGCLVVSPGTYIINTALTLPACTRGIGYPRIKYNGTVTTYVAHMGYAYGYYVGQIIFDGNGKTSHGLQFDNAINPTVDRVQVTNVTVSGFHGAYVQSGHFIKPVVSGNAEAFATTPVNCILLDTSTSSDNHIDDPVCDHVSGAGLLFKNAINSFVNGGTSEGNAIGIDCEGNSGQICRANHFTTMDVEANTTDIVINGQNAYYNTFTGMASGYASTNGVHVTAATGNATGNMFVGGTYGSFVLDSNAYLTKLVGVQLPSCPTDNGYMSVMEGVQGGVTKCGDKTSWDQNFNGAVTANGVTSLYTANVSGIATFSQALNANGINSFYSTTYTGAQDFSGAATVKLPTSVTVGANSITLPSTGGTLAELTGTAHGLKISQGTSSAETTVAVCATGVPIVGVTGGDPVCSASGALGTGAFAPAYVLPTITAANVDSTVVTTGTTAGSSKVTKLASNYTNGTTTASSLSGLASGTVASGGVLGFTCYLTALGTSTSRIKWQFTGPASPTTFTAKVYDGTTATSDTIATLTAFGSATAGCTSSCTATALGTKLQGVLVNGSNSGAVQLQGISSTSGQTVTVYAGSYCAWY